MTSAAKRFKPNINPDRLKLTVCEDVIKKSVSNDSGLHPKCNITYEEIKENEKIERQMEISYQDLEKTHFLGKGGFGEVWKMTHKPSERVFAVKIIHVSQMEPWDQKSVELEASKRIGHSSPYLISFYGALHVDSHIWLLTEPMDLSLEKFNEIKNHFGLRIPDHFYSHVARSTLNGLAHMKSLKLIHRDIKPSNILMDSCGSIKLCDFGISGFTKDSICNSVKGCYTYMAPERLDVTKQGYSIKSDIWSLGITLIEVASGVHPYSDLKDGPYVLSNTIVNEEPPKLDSEKFGKDFCDFVDNCLNKDVSLRPECRSLLDKHPFVSRELTMKMKGYNTEIIKYVTKRGQALE